MANIRWTGGATANHPVSGSWSVGTNWAGGVAPSLTDTATLGGNGGSAPYTVTLDVDATVQGLVMDAAKSGTPSVLAIGAHTFTVTNNNATAINLSQGGNDITIAGGILNVNGGTSAGITAVAGNTISGAGTINASGPTAGIDSAGGIIANRGMLELNAVLVGTAQLLVTAGTDTLKLDKASSAASLGFNASTGTLELNTAATLTLSTALVLAAGTVKLDAATSALTDNAGISLTTGTITGVGTVTGAVTAGANAGHITANGGTLIMASAVTGTALLLADTAATDTLQFNAAGNTASSVTLNGGTLRLNATATTLTVTNAMAIGTGTVNLVAVGATLTDAAGLTLAGGHLIGLGSIAANTNISGFGTVAIPISTAGSITASGGLLDMQGAVTGRSLVISGIGNTLQLDAAADATASLTMNGGTLRLNGAIASLSDSTALVVGTGTVDLVGGATLTDTSGISLAAGGKIIGVGVVNGNISGAGTIEGSGGTLKVSNNLSSSTLLLAVDSAPLSVLELGGTISTSTTFTYLNTGTIFSGTLRLDSGALGTFQTFGTISGMHVATGTGVTATDVLDLRSVAFASVNSTDILNGNTIEVWGNAAHTNLLASFHLAAPVAAGTQAHFVSDGSTGTNFFLDDDPCYVAGTRILTATGERMVESLMQGDIVLALAGGELTAQPVKWIGQRRIDLTAHPRPETAAPIRIRRGAFADNMPHSDLLVSPDHAVFVDGKLICARQLVNGSTIRQEKDRTSVEYFHVELDAHAILLAEGLPAESYLNTGNHGFFINSGEPLVLHPDMTDETDYPTREAGSCAPFVSDEASVRPVWQRLAERAAALGQPAPKLDTTSDPELRIVAKGRTVRPLYGENGLYIFALPKGATEVRLISRAGAPTNARPWLDDRRCLGVNVERIVLRGASELQEVPVDHPGLSQGWHTVERDGVALRRWTSGDAMLPLPALRGPTMLEIRASSGGMAYLADAEQEQRAA